MILCIQKPKLTFVENEEILDHLMDISVLDSEAVLIGEEFDFVQKRTVATGKVFYVLTNENGTVCIMQEDDGIDVFEDFN